MKVLIFKPTLTYIGISTKNGVFIFKPLYLANFIEAEDINIKIAVSATDIHIKKHWADDLTPLIIRVLAPGYSPHST